MGHPDASGYFITFRAFSGWIDCNKAKNMVSCIIEFVSAGGSAAGNADQQGVIVCI